MTIQPEELIRRAADDGVLLVISSQGRVKAKGAREAVDEWLPVLRQRRAEIFEALGGGSAPLVNRHTSPSRNLERVLKGQAIALYCDSLKQTLWLVADEEDAQLLGERRGLVYTADEIRLVASIDDPDFVPTPSCPGTHPTLRTPSHKIRPILLSPLPVLQSTLRAIPRSLNSRAQPHGLGQRALSPVRL